MNRGTICAKERSFRLLPFRGNNCGLIPTALWKRDIPMQLDIMIAKASNIYWVFFVSLHLHSNLHFEDQVKIAKLMSHSILAEKQNKNNMLFFFFF